MNIGLVRIPLYHAGPKALVVGLGAAVKSIGWKHHSRRYRELLLWLLTFVQYRVGAANGVRRTWTVGGIPRLAKALG